MKASWRNLIIGTPSSLRSAEGAADGRECGGLRGVQFRAMEATWRNLIVGTPSSLQSAVIAVELSDVCYREPHLHGHRSEEPTSALQSLMRLSYAVLCLNTNRL